MVGSLAVVSFTPYKKAPKKKQNKKQKKLNIHLTFYDGMLLYSCNKESENYLRLELKAYSFKPFKKS